MEKTKRNTQRPRTKLRNPKIFNNYDFFVTGNDKIKDLIKKRGGNIRKEYEPGVFHIIDNSKQQNEFNHVTYSHQWIQDSVKSKKLLEISEYAIDPNTSRKSRKSSFTPDSRSVSRRLVFNEEASFPSPRIGASHGKEGKVSDDEDGDEERTFKEQAVSPASEPPSSQEMIFSLGRRSNDKDINEDEDEESDNDNDNDNKPNQNEQSTRTQRNKPSNKTPISQRLRTRRRTPRPPKRPDDASVTGDSSEGEESSSAVRTLPEQRKRRSIPLRSRARKRRKVLKGKKEGFRKEDQNDGDDETELLKELDVAAASDTKTIEDNQPREEEEEEEETRQTLDKKVLNNVEEEEEEESVDSFDLIPDSSPHKQQQKQQQQQQEEADNDMDNIQVENDNNNNNNNIENENDNNSDDDDIVQDHQQQHGNYAAQKSQFSPVINYLIEKSGQDSAIVLHALHVNNGDVKKALLYLLYPQVFAQDVWQPYEDELLIEKAKTVNRRHSANLENRYSHLIRQRGEESVQRRIEFLKPSFN